MKRSFFIVGITLLMLAIICPAYADTISWKGLTWTIRGASNSATLTSEGYLSISVLGGNSGDPAPDNWALFAKPTNAMWMQFTFADPGGNYSPRAYASEHLEGNVGEMLMQGGVLAPISQKTYTNMNVYEYALGDFVFGNWSTIYTNRQPGDHTFKVGLGAGGEVDFIYDGKLAATYRIGQYYPVWTGSGYEDVQFTWTADLLKIAYLGVDTASGTNATIVYKDFQYGTSYNPVPEPTTLMLLGFGLVGLVAAKKKGTGV